MLEKCVFLLYFFWPSLLFFPSFYFLVSYFLTLFKFIFCRFRIRSPSPSPSNFLSRTPRARNRAPSTSSPFHSHSPTPPRIGSPEQSRTPATPRRCRTPATPARSAHRHTSPSRTPRTPETPGNSHPDFPFLVNPLTEFQSTLTEIFNRTRVLPDDSIRAITKRVRGTFYKIQEEERK